LCCHMGIVWLHGDLLGTFCTFQTKTTAHPLRIRDSYGCAFHYRFRSFLYVVRLDALRSNAHTFYVIERSGYARFAYLFRLF
jgi:hypothetical protein